MNGYMNLCDACMHASLDCGFCYLWRRKTEPTSSCAQHTRMSDKHNALSKTVCNEIKPNTNQ